MAAADSGPAAASTGRVAWRRRETRAGLAVWAPARASAPSDRPAAAARQVPGGAAGADPPVAGRRVVALAGVAAVVVAVGVAGSAVRNWCGRAGCSHPESGARVPDPALVQPALVAATASWPAVRSAHVEATRPQGPRRAAPKGHLCAWQAVRAPRVDRRTVPIPNRASVRSPAAAAPGGGKARPAVVDRKALPRSRTDHRVSPQQVESTPTRLEPCPEGPSHVAYPATVRSGRPSKSRSPGSRTAR